MSERERIKLTIDGLGHSGELSAERPAIRIVAEDIEEPVRLIKRTPETSFPPVTRTIKIFAATIGYPAAWRKKKRHQA